LDFYKFWLEQFNGDVHVVYYNNLKSNIAAELTEAIKWLGHEPDALRIDCTLNFPTRTYFKRKVSEKAIDKKKLFYLASTKSRNAENAFREIIEKRFGTEHSNYKRFSLHQ